ncbi:MAG: SPOR domain-containing protein [Muribaculaceae bacterium]|nr:SPOR domain-containing protein [Muribaculaceae bacterium]
MLSKYLKIIIGIVVLSMAQTVYSQETAKVISDHIESESGGKVKVNQPDALRNRLVAKQGLVEETEVVETKAVGYRIQVYSDNNQRTAKANAQARERNIAVHFPEHRVYRMYKSPSWRVRVGDFRTRGDAEQVMKEIKDVFPAYASEVTIVVDKINIEEK